MVDYLMLTIPQALRLAAKRLREMSGPYGTTKYDDMQYEADACQLAAEGLEHLCTKRLK